jgi:hypothetical protein
MHGEARLALHACIGLRRSVSSLPTFTCQRPKACYQPHLTAVLDMHTFDCSFGYAQAVCVSSQPALLLPSQILLALVC